MSSRIQVTVVALFFGMVSAEDGGSGFSRAGMGTDNRARATGGDGAFRSS